MWTVSLSAASSHFRSALPPRLDSLLIKTFLQKPIKKSARRPARVARETETREESATARGPRPASRRPLVLSLGLFPPVASPQSPLSTLRTVTESAVTPTAVACTPSGDYTPSRPAEPGPCGLRTPNHKTTRHSRRARPCPPPQAEPEDGVRNVGIWRTQQPAPRAAPAGAAFHDRHAPRPTPAPSRGPHPPCATRHPPASHAHPRTQAHPPRHTKSAASHLDPLAATRLYEPGLVTTSRNGRSQ